MGRRGNMRSRPGVLFFIVFLVCLVIVYLSWRSMSPTSIKAKDAYSVQMQNLLDDSSKWNKIDGNQGENHDRDPDYDLQNMHRKKVMTVPTLRHFDLSNDKEIFKKQDPKQHLTDDKSSEKQTLETDGKAYYRKPNNLITETVMSMERFVHLDLKGAAPKMSYFKDFIPLVKKLGATGLLIEYEDMFPYTGMLQYISAKNAYSMDDIQELQNFAKANNLKVMPLIQTFGHMEFVLKSDFNKLRENAYTPQVIDITQNASYSLIAEMVKQILNAHPDATHLHVGCDEVYELGKGATSLQMKSQNLSEAQMFLRHVQRVASIVREYNGRGVKAIIWDDELRKISLRDLQGSRLSYLVEIMVWHYTKRVSEIIRSDVWNKYARVFKSIWIASAFKGATGARQFFTEPDYHIQNHFGWLDVIAANNQQVNFKGVALTGWQRYDHFATLCELLPVSLPSLAVCLATMTNGGFTKEIHMAASRLLQCSELIEMSFPVLDQKTERSIVTQDCRFPGHELYHAIQELYGYTAGMTSIQHRLDGWLSDYQLNNHFSNPGQLRVLSRSLGKQNSGFSMVSIPLKRHLSSIYQDDTVDEWMDENIFERQRNNDKQQKKIKSLDSYTSWPQRPLAASVYTRQKFNDTKDENSDRLVPNRFSNVNAESNDKRPNQNIAESKFALRNQQNRQQENPAKVIYQEQKKSIDFNVPNEQIPVKEVPERNSFGGNQNLDSSNLNNLKGSKEDPNLRNTGSIDFRGFNKKNKTMMRNYWIDKLNQQNIRTDEKRNDNAHVENKRPTDEKPPTEDKIPVNVQVDEDDQMRREKYLINQKLDREIADRINPKPLDIQTRQRGKPDDFGAYREGFKVRNR